MRSSAPQISKVGAWISGSRFSSLVLPSGQKARAAASLARTCSIGHSGELAPSGSVLSWFQRSGSAQIRAGTSGARCAHGSVIGSFSSNNPHGAISARRRTEPGQIAAISAANEPPTELPARSAPSSPAFCSRWRTASTQSRWLSSTVCPRSPPGKPGSDGTMTVRSRANASRNGIQRGNPPKPARKPSFGPSPFLHTRHTKPLISTDSASASVTIVPALTDSLGRHCRRLEWGQSRPRVVRHRLRPPAVLPFGEHIGQLWHDLFGEELRVVLREILAHVAELHQQHQVPD